MAQAMKPSLSQEMSALLDTEFETASFFAPRIWSSIPQEYTEYNSTNEFKAKIKFWYSENCPCKLCKNYIITNRLYIARITCCPIASLLSES